MSKQPNIVVRITSNVREFIRGAEQVEDALEDLAAESGDLARDVESDTERMERAFRDAGRDIARSTDKAGRDAGRNLRSGTRQAGRDAGKETASEFASNLGESLASGDIKAIGADTAGGLISGFASMGGAAGAVLAGIAIPTTILFQRLQQDRERLASLGAGMVAAIRDGMVEESEREDILLKALGVEDLNAAYDKAQKLAETIGLPVAEVLRSIAYGEESQAVTDMLADVDERVERAGLGRKNPRPGKSRLSSDLESASDGAKQLRDYIREVDTGLDDARVKAETLNAVLSGQQRSPGSYSTSRDGYGQRLP